MCNSKLRFRYVCVAGPGKLNDNRAFDRCTVLRRWMKELPDKYFLIGDNAYPLLNSLLVPFKGCQKLDDYNSSYNFYLSQLRIQIEMAFGRMTTKFWLLKQKISVSLKVHSKIIQAVTRLHNYIIETDGLPHFLGKFSDVPLSWIGNDPGSAAFLPLPPLRFEQGNCARREAIVTKLKDKTMKRPQWNIDRNSGRERIEADTDYDESDD